MVNKKTKDWKHLVAKDNHFCDSVQEVIIDDFLSTNKIEHQRGVRLEFGDVVCCPDFIVGDNIIVEVLMVDYNSELGKSKVKRRYVDKYLRKKKAYLENKQKLFEIFPSDFLIKEKMESRLLQLCEMIGSKPIDLKKFSKFGFYHRKSPGYWWDFENVKKELLRVVDDYGYVPNDLELRKWGNKTLLFSIQKYFGGLEAVTTKLGLDFRPKSKPNGYWLDRGNLIREIKSLADSLGKFPNAEEIRKHNSNSMVKAILNEFGSFRNAAIELGYKSPNTKPKGYWEKFENIFAEVNKVYGGEVPSARKMAKENSILFYAINRYYGGIVKFRELFNERLLVLN